MPKKEVSIIVPSKVPVVALCSPAWGIEVLLDRARAVSKGDKFVLLLRSGDGIEGRILPAYLNAYVRYREGNMRSDSLPIELMLFIAGTLNIGKAIREYGAKEGSGLLVIASDEALLGKFIMGNGLKEKERPALSIGGKGFHPVLQ